MILIELPFHSEERPAVDNHTIEWTELLCDLFQCFLRHNACDQIHRAQLMIIFGFELQIGHQVQLAIVQDVFLDAAPIGVA